MGHAGGERERLCRHGADRRVRRTARTVGGVRGLAAGRDRLPRQLHHRLVLRAADPGAGARRREPGRAGLHRALGRALPRRRGAGLRGRQPVRLYTAVIAGGILGSLLRWLAALVLPAVAGGLPWPTLFANVAGCWVIGFYAGLTGPDGRLFVDPRTRQFVMTGICGGFTTFSGFSLEMLRFVQAGDARQALIYLGVSVAGWLAAVWLGDIAARRLNNRAGL